MEGLAGTPHPNRLRYLRETRTDSSQRRIADKVDRHWTSVNRHEAGERELTLDVLSRYAKVYECHIIDIFLCKDY